MHTHIYLVAVVAVSVELFLHQLVHDGLVLGFLGFKLRRQAVVVLFVTVVRQLLQNLRRCWECGQKEGELRTNCMPRERPTVETNWTSWANALGRNSKKR